MYYACGVCVHVSLQDASLAILEQLLQLAVGGPAAAIEQHNNSNGANNTDAAHTKQQQQQREQTPPGSNSWYPPMLLNSAAQQQQWGTAAYRAVQLFNLQELLSGPSGSGGSSGGGLDPNCWHQALLLQPRLLDQLLEAAAAAVLQPLLPAGQLAGHSLDRVQNQQTGCTKDSKAVSQQAALFQASSSSSSIMALLASSGLPWQQLPAILAVNPLLMLKVRFYLNSTEMHLTYLQLKTQACSSVVICHTSSNNCRLTVRTSGQSNRSCSTSCRVLLQCTGHGMSNVCLIILCMQHDIIQFGQRSQAQKHMHPVLRVW
jgi:hypothetical protein